MTTASAVPATPSLGALWRITTGHRARYLAAIAALGVATLFVFATPLLGKLAIDRVQGLPTREGLQPYVGLAEAMLPGVTPLTSLLACCGIAIVLLTACGGVFHYLRGKHTAIAAEAIARAVREALFDRLQQVPVSYHDTADTGDLVQRCSSDVETLRVFLASDVVEIGRALLLIVIVVPILFALDTRLAWVSLVLLPPIVAFAYGFFRRIQDNFRVADEAEASMTTCLQENLTGVRVVRAFTRQEHEIAKFAMRNGAFRDLNNRLIRTMGFFWAGSDLMAMAQIGLVLGFGAMWLAEGSLGAGTLFAFLTYESMVIWPIRQMGRILTDSGKAAVSLRRIADVLTVPIETQPAPAPSRGRARGDLHFEAVDFGYLAGRPVLHDLSLHVRAGETVALVGPPGSGKSSIVRLLLRLYDPQQGRVLLDGIDVSSLDRQYVRAQFGVVLQEPFLYSRSIADNLRIGRPEADQALIETATRDAAIHDSIREFPAGYAAPVGERGLTLSGGQRQRIALARALLRDPPVLVLDDALSAVDTRTEAHILAALRRRAGRQTTLIIAHRLTSLAHADRVLVLDQGRLVQDGPPDVLASIEGPYQRLCRIQGDLDARVRADLAGGSGGR